MADQCKLQFDVENMTDEELYALRDRVVAAITARTKARVARRVELVPPLRREQVVKSGRVLHTNNDHPGAFDACPNSLCRAARKFGS